MQFDREYQVNAGRFDKNDWLIIKNGSQELHVREKG
jgi:hypothetical protein